MHGRARVAWNLRRIRTERKISQENLAVDAGVDRTYESGIERQDFNPTVDVLERLAEALSVDISEFFAIPDTGAVLTEPLKRGRRPSRQKP